MHAKDFHGSAAVSSASSGTVPAGGDSGAGGFWNSGQAFGFSLQKLEGVVGGGSRSGFGGGDGLGDGTGGGDGAGVDRGMELGGGAGGRGGASWNSGQAFGFSLQKLDGSAGGGRRNGLGGGEGWEHGSRAGISAVLLVEANIGELNRVAS